MSRESILKIKETETQAEQLIREAREAAGQMIAEAERNGKELCDRAEAESLAARREMMDRIRERIAEMTERTDTEAKDEVEEMKKAVTLRRKMAEKIIIRGLEAKCR